MAPRGVRPGMARGKARGKARGRARVAGAAAVVALLLAPGLAQANHAGDGWSSAVRMALHGQDGPVVLTLTWDTWAMWPIPFAGQEHRVSNVAVTAQEAGLPAAPLPGAAVAFVQVGMVPYLVRIFEVRVTAQDLVWTFRWQWDAYDGCGFNGVVGRAAPMDARYRGAQLAPVASPDVGTLGLSLKTGPGEDGLYECYPGNLW